MDHVVPRRHAAYSTTKSSLPDGHRRLALLVSFIVVIATLVTKPVEAHSTRLAPHKRLHVPRNVKYTLVRKRDPAAYTSSSWSDSIGGSRQGAGLTSLARRQQGQQEGTQPMRRYAAKRSSPPAPFHIIDGNVERASYSDTILLQFEVPLTAPTTVSDGHENNILSNSYMTDTSSNDNTPLERISMLLRPSDNIVAPEARIVYINTDPATGKTYENVQPLHREDVLAYSGYVVQEHEVDARLKEARIGLRPHDEDQISRGWARIVLSHDELAGRTLAEGAFTLDGETHHLKSIRSWSASRHEDEPSLHARHLNENEGLVLLRDRDLSEGAFQPATGSSFSKRDNQAESSSLTSRSASELPSSSGCAHDHLSYNADLEHPIYRSARQQAFDVLYSRKPGFFDNILGVSPASYGGSSGASFVKRQGGGDLAGGGNMTSNYINSINSTTGCPKSAQVLYMGLAADCTYVAKVGGADDARTQMLNNLNEVSILYQRSFNISLGAVELQVVNGSCPSVASSNLPWNTQCPSSSSTTSSANALNLNSRLSAFSQWRGNKGGGDGAGLWHLLTDCNDGSEVGVAWLGTLCRVSTSSSSDGEVTSGTGVTSSTSREWQVMAHEIGHNFGAIHDCASGCSLSQACCPLSRSQCNANAAYIMSPVSQQNTTSFSPCSIGNICSALGTTLNTTCLYTPGNRQVISLQQCGNGILEPGEECDPGGNDSPCCDASTCKLRSGAQCDPATNTCCSSSCNYAPSGQVCRPAVTESCDIAETCTGNSADCPADETVKDGTSCGSNGLKCASGYCTSKDEQCASLGASMGITKACSSVGDNSCEVTCQSPNSAFSCTILEGQFFTEGTECGYGGHCRNGSCQSGSWQDTVAGWYRDNLRISIPVTVVGGIVILLILFGLIKCIVRGCRRGYRAPSSAYAKNNGPPPPPPPQAPFMNQRSSPPGGSFASNQPFNQSYGYEPPTQPYPTYGGYNNGPSNNQGYR